MKNHYNRAAQLIFHMAASSVIQTQLLSPRLVALIPLELYMDWQHKSSREFIMFLYNTPRMYTLQRIPSTKPSAEFTVCVPDTDLKVSRKFDIVHCRQTPRDSYVCSYEDPR